MNSYQQPQPGKAPRRFFTWVRSSGLIRGNDRWIGGVCSGIAQRLGWSPTLVRALMIVATLFFGFGAALYAMGWFLIPDVRSGQILAEDLIEGEWDWNCLGCFLFMAVAVLIPGAGWVCIALAALVLFACYTEDLGRFFPNLNVSFSLQDPYVLVGLFIGGLLPYLFGAMGMMAVGRAGSAVVVEVRRQFREIKGILTGETEPDYERCVAISTKGAQREMVIPSLIAIIAPIATGLIFGVPGVLGLLIGGLSSGFVLAIFMANAGGA